MRALSVDEDFFGQQIIELLVLTLSTPCCSVSYPPKKKKEVNPIGRGDVVLPFIVLNTNYILSLQCIVLSKYINWSINSNVK